MAVKTQLREILRKKRNPEQVLLDANFNATKSMIETTIRTILRESMDNAHAILKQGMENMRMEIERDIEDFVNSVVETVQKNGELTGPQGIQGLKGDSIKGDGGDMGPQGKKGMVGKVGGTGPKGETGESGSDGKDGKDGSSDSSEEVVEKINGAKKKIKPIQIEGLQTALREVKRAKKGGGASGGGYGNPERFSFTGNGSTTTFTLSSNVAGDGDFIWAHTDSGWLQPRVHFNISGTTLTTTYTPENGAIIEGFYMRT